MPDYRRINNRLIIALNDIIDNAKAAIEEAEENIISDAANQSNLHTFPLKENK